MPTLTSACPISFTVFMNGCHYYHSYLCWSDGTSTLGTAGDTVQHQVGGSCTNCLDPINPLQLLLKAGRAGGKAKAKAFVVGDGLKAKIRKPSRDYAGFAPSASAVAGLASALTADSEKLIQLPQAGVTLVMIANRSFIQYKDQGKGGETVTARVFDIQLLKLEQFNEGSVIMRIGQEYDPKGATVNPDTNFEHDPDQSVGYYHRVTRPDDSQDPIDRLPYHIFRVKK
jgi:hypothetical protein